MGLSHRNEEDRTAVVVAGPGRATTIPGIIVSEIVHAVSLTAQVSRIEVDLGLDYTVGLHRAPSLAVAHRADAVTTVASYRAPDSARFRAQAFRDWLGSDVKTAIAYAWPGIDNSWIKPFVQIARTAGITSVVAIASLPRTTLVRPASLADTVARADLVLVGDEADAIGLSRALGSSGPVVEAHEALSLSSRDGRGTGHQITAFLRRGSTSTLSSLLAAFDAIPEAWIDEYHLQVVMRHAGQIFPEMIANSYHGDHVRLIGEDLSRTSLEDLCAASSVLGVADPTNDSRAFSAAMDFGIATVVLTSSSVPEVGKGYVGGLLADLAHPASVHVALRHALRLAELSFPSPDAWDELALRLSDPRRTTAPASRLLEPAATR
ncbi:MAG TPA: hypothetical protein VGZ33_05480 [Acidimicrobiales bacterium]|jgi:hypothetical protein|nr:hypothetical protein [Acidimicrobiales bacterium]